MEFDEFRTLAQQYNLIPVGKTILADCITPVSAYVRLRPERGCSFLFESVEGGERVARYSFLGRDPLMLIACRGTTTTIEEHGKPAATTTEDFFSVVRRCAAQYRQPPSDVLPRFAGGLLGFVGYDAVRFIEKLQIGRASCRERV